MKNVLLTTTALVAFAGAAAADVAVTWSGTAMVEYDVDASEFSYGATANVDATFTQELNNGSVASLALGGLAVWDIAEGDDVLLDPTWIAKLDTSYGSISAGDIANANDGGFASTAGMIVGGDVHEVGFGADSHDILATTSVGGMNIAASTTLDGVSNSVNVTGSAGTINFGAFYESNAASVIEIDGNGNDETDDLAGDYVVERTGTSMGFFAGTEISGLSIDVAYAAGDYVGCAYTAAEGESLAVLMGCETGTPASTSMGIALGYSINSAVSVSASYASNTYNADYVSSIDDLDLIANEDYAIASNNQIAVGIAYAADGVTASLDYDVDAQTYEAAAGYTTEISAGTTMTVGATYDGTDFGGSVDLVHVAGDMSLYAGADMDSNTYAGVVYDLGAGATAYGYYSNGDELGPKAWDAGTVLGLAMTF